MIEPLFVKTKDVSITSEHVSKIKSIMDDEVVRVMTARSKDNSWKMKIIRIFRKIRFSKFIVSSRIRILYNRFIQWFKIKYFKWETEVINGELYRTRVAHSIFKRSSTNIIYKVEIGYTY